MTIEYIYKVVSIQRPTDRVIVMKVLEILEDTGLIYRLSFEFEDECSNYMRVIHNLIKDLNQNGVSEADQKKFICDFIEENPFNYEYEWDVK